MEWMSSPASDARNNLVQDLVQVKPRVTRRGKKAASGIFRPASLSALLVAIGSLAMAGGQLTLIGQQTSASETSPLRPAAESLPPQKSADDTANVRESIAKRLETLSRLSKTASTATEYSDIIEQCGQILALEPERAEHTRYLKSLAAWALCRRATTRYELAQRFRKIGNDVEADKIVRSMSADLERALAFDPGKWQAMQLRAVLATEQGDYTAAIAEWSELLQLELSSEVLRKARFNRAEVQYSSGAFAAALQDYQRVLADDPNDLQAINGCGNCLLGLGRLDEAIVEYDRVLALQPGSPGALINRGDAWQQKREWNRALMDFRTAANTELQSLAQQRLAWLLATCPDSEVADPKESLTLILTAIASDGETLDNLDTLAAALAANGEFDRARDVQTRLVSLLDEEGSGQDGDYRVRQALYENNEPFQQDGDSP